MRNILLLITSCFLIATFSLSAQNKSAVKLNYQLPARFSAEKVSKMIFSTSVEPHWLKNSNRFWYSYRTSEGTKWYIVNPATGSKQELFDNAKMASEITTIVKDPFDEQHLPITNLKFTDKENSIKFEIKSSIDEEIKDKKTGKPKNEKKIFYFEYNLTDGRLTHLAEYKKPEDRPTWASISPDGEKIVFGRNHNLYSITKADYEKLLVNDKDSTVTERQITKDGEKDFLYCYEYSTLNTDTTQNDRKRASVLWSPDSKHFATMRSDLRKVKELWVINNVANPRPTLETYKYHMPGEAEAQTDHLYVCDYDKGEVKSVNISAFKNQDLSIDSRPTLKKDRDNDYNPRIWLGNNNTFYYTRTSRDLKRIDICAVEVATATSKTLIEERLNTYVEVRPLVVIGDGKELIQWSERDGWGHLYLYNGDGTLKNRITNGSYHCEEILGVDEATRTIYFAANGRENGENPYYMHFYSVKFDGSGLKLLNPGDFDHTSTMNDDTKYFVDNFSRVNTIPKSTLFDSNGRKVMELETADLAQLFAAGYKFPEPYKVKADDGVTDLYGVMYKPYDFDSTKSYPIIEYVYPGPQTEAVNFAFTKVADRVDRLAQFGFIVVTVGNRGGHPSRSKWYHNYGYGNLRDYGLADKRAAAIQLADRYKFIDLSRVGIHGHSGGGFMSTAAILSYPDFFKAAVSCAGNHDNSIYNRWWSEKHHGVKEQVSDKGDTTFVYNIEKNQDIAKNLKGNLLLITGDVDNNVHHANTIRVVNALIRANKRFEMLMLPGQQHGFGDMTEYFFWKMGDHFSKSFFGQSETTIDIPQMAK